MSDATDTRAGSLPVIEPVRQVTLVPIRPAVGWYWLGGALIVIGSLGAFLVLTVAAFGFINAIDGLDRIVVGDERTVTMPEGEVFAYFEPEGGAVVGSDGLEIVVIDDRGVEVAVSPSGGEQYDIEQRRGYRVAALEPPVAGRYLVVVTGETDGSVALGRSPRRDLGRSAVLASLVGAVGVVGGSTVLVVTRRRRASAIRARALGDTDLAHRGD